MTIDEKGMAVRLRLGMVYSLIGLLVGVSLYAQQPLPRQLDVEEAVRLALSGNRSYAREIEGLEQQRIVRDTACPLSVDQRRCFRRARTFS